MQNPAFRSEESEKGKVKELNINININTVEKNLESKRGMDALLNQIKDCLLDQH